VGNAKCDGGVCWEGAPPLWVFQEAGLRILYRNSILSTTRHPIVILLPMSSYRFQGPMLKPTRWKS
jgi:hypothetical protein